MIEKFNSQNFKVEPVKPVNTDHVLDLESTSKRLFSGQRISLQIKRPCITRTSHIGPLQKLLEQNKLIMKMKHLKEYLKYSFFIKLHKRQNIFMEK